MKLSKTNFLIYLDCFKNVWLKIHKNEIYRKKTLSSFELNIINSGNDIDILARDLFPNGVLVESRDDTNLTKKLMKERTPVIYQPVFSTDKFITASDIFVWNSKTDLYDLYEVKSSSASKDGKNNKIKEYLIDIAFQKNVLDDLNIEIGTLNLIRLNSKYIRIGNIDLEKLFLKEDLTNEVNQIIQGVKMKMNTAHELLSSDKEPRGHCDCIYKGKNSHCTTSWYSNSDLPEDSVHSISRINKKKLTELIDSDIFDICDVPEDFKLSDNQRGQIDVAISNRENINRTGISSFLETIEYPLSFLDYETYPSAIPKYDRYRPYQQIPFQFSLHIIESPGKEIIHHEFIYTEKECPDKCFIEALKEYLPTRGSIIVWSQSFEKGRNKDIAERLPSYKDFVENLNGRVVDLMIPFSGKTRVYNHPKFKGSASIKYVLPALVPTMSYSEMHIKEGGTASDTWNRIVSDKYSKKDKNIEIQALKDYCCLDTLAMVEIWKVLKSVLG